MPFIFSEADLACMQPGEGRLQPHGPLQSGQDLPDATRPASRSGRRLPPASDRREGPRPAVLARTRRLRCRSRSARQAAPHRRRPPRAHRRGAARPTWSRAARPRRWSSRARARKSPRWSPWPASRACRSPRGAAGPSWRSARRPSRIGLVLALKRLDRILEHEPGDLTVTVEAGITSTRLQAELGKRGQWLSLDPAASDRATRRRHPRQRRLGPAPASLRHRARPGDRPHRGRAPTAASCAAAARWSRTWRATICRSSTSAPSARSAILVEATFKLRPRADVDRLVVARFDRLKDAGAGGARGARLRPHPVRASSCSTTRRSSGSGQGDGAALLVGLDGIAPQVEWQVAELGRLLAPAGPAREPACSMASRATRPGARCAALGRPGHDAVAAVMKWAVLPTPAGRADGRRARPPPSATGSARR